MKRLAVLLLAACFAIPACSAKNEPEQTAATDPASAAIAAIDVTDADNVVLARADGRVPDTTLARTPAPESDPVATAAPAPADTPTADPAIVAEPTDDPRPDAPAAPTPAPESDPVATAAPAPADIPVADPTIVLAQAAKPVVNAPAERADIVEGTHYRLLTPTQPTSSSPDKVEVAEVFMYSCPHCYSFEPFVNSFLADKPTYVSFVRLPASFNKIARNHAKAYYAAETLGVLDDVHLRFFHAYHTENKKLTDENALIDFFTANGVNKADAEKAMNSFAVDTKLRQADNLMRRYRIDSVPALVINGKYVTSGSMAGSIAKLDEIVDYLVAKEAAAM